jgi:hypothetical protein
VAEALDISVIIELAPRKQEFELSTTQFGTIFSRSLLNKISEILESFVSYRSYIYILQGTLPKLNRHTRGFPKKKNKKQKKPSCEEKCYSESFVRWVTKAYGITADKGLGVSFSFPTRRQKVDTKNKA